MAETRQRSATPSRGLWGAILSLGVLSCLAFVVGGVAGLVWKEPGLLFAYLTGDTTEVAWAAEAGSLETVLAIPEPSPPTPPSTPAHTLPSVPKPPRTPSVAEVPSPLPPVAAPPPSGASIAVQVGAFAERGSAEQLRGELLKDGIPAYVAAGAASGSPRWRVRVGPYRSREDADRMAAQLKSKRSLPTWVLDEDAP